MQEAMASLERRVAKRMGDPDEGGCIYWTGLINPVSGYGQIGVPLALREAGWHRTCTAPWVVARLHHPETWYEGAYVLHSCRNGSRGCCAPEHLRWGTAAENLQDRVLDGNQPTAILAPDDVRAIRRRHAKPAMASYRRLAEEYGVGWETIRNAVTGRSWSWLPDE